MRALFPSPVPAGITQHGSRLGESALHASPARTIRRFHPDNIAHGATRGYLLLPSPRIIEYSDDHILIVFPSQHLLYHPPLSLTILLQLRLSLTILLQLRLL